MACEIAGIPKRYALIIGAYSFVINDRAAVFLFFRVALLRLSDAVFKGYALGVLYAFRGVSFLTLYLTSKNKKGVIFLACVLR